VVLAADRFTCTRCLRTNERILEDTKRRKSIVPSPEAVKMATAELNVDHRDCRRDGGLNTLDNAQTLCMPCHSMKSKLEVSVRAAGPLAPPEVSDFLTKILFEREGSSVERVSVYNMITFYTTIEVRRSGGVTTDAVDATLREHPRFNSVVVASSRGKKPPFAMVALTDAGALMLDFCNDSRRRGVERYEMGSNPSIDAVLFDFAPVFLESKQRSHLQRIITLTDRSEMEGGYFSDKLLDIDKSMLDFFKTSRLVESSPDCEEFCRVTELGILSA
jgi:hypothetical protein